EVRNAGLTPAVTFAGGVAHEDVPQHLAAMDVAIAPYPALDNFYYSPLKLFEYMAAGRPVVASRVGQVAEVVVDGVTGLLFGPGEEVLEIFDRSANRHAVWSTSLRFLFEGSRA